MDKCNECRKREEVPEGAVLREEAMEWEETFIDGFESNFKKVSQVRSPLDGKVYPIAASDKSHFKANTNSEIVGIMRDHQVFEKWPQSPEYWGYKTWREVGAYAIGHGIGLTLRDRPFFNQMQKELGVQEQTFKTGMVLAVETYAGKKGGKDGVRLEENILVTDDGYERLSLWPIEELMECWLPYN